jgi:hypothetical protein
MTGAGWRNAVDEDTDYLRSAAVTVSVFAMIFRLAQENGNFSGIGFAGLKGVWSIERPADRNGRQYAQTLETPVEPDQLPPAATRRRIHEMGGR